MLYLAEKRRLECRFEADLADKIEYFAQKEGLSKTDFLEEAAKYYIAYLMGDFDISSPMVQRLNQMLEVMIGVDSRLSGLEDTTRAGLQSIMQLSRGENYLLTDD